MLSVTVIHFQLNQIIKARKPLVTGTPGTKIHTGLTALIKEKGHGMKTGLHCQQQDGSLKAVHSLQMEEVNTRLADLPTL